MNKELKRKQARFIYTGRVQGVGFRFTVQRIASDLNLVGWVRNLPDGRVEALVEGEEKSLEEFIGRIDNQFQGYIRKKDIVFQDPKGKYSSFEINF
ncbi:MAG: acylphosphatase [Candidatus Omnitrophota bacterium]